MLRTFFTLALISTWSITHAQSNSGHFSETCVYLAELDTTHETKKMLVDLWKLNAVTLGDAGESRNAQAYLSRFHRFTEYFDSAYHDTTLVEIVKSNYCPLVSCYAFEALVTKSNDAVNNQLLYKLIRPFAQDTTSFVYLDWGCGRSRKETFDYMFTLIRRHHEIYRADNTLTSNRELVENLLELRKPYYRDRSGNWKEITWEIYSGSILHLYKR